MENYSPEHFGKAAADYYDDHLVQREPPSGTAVELLAKLTGDSRRLLEIGAGTGRFAIPLAAIGVEVVAVDISQAMLDRLTDHAQAEALEVATHALDATRTLPPGEFGVIGYFFNTLFMVGDRERQGETLRLAAAQLGSGGRVVVEAFVPNESMFGVGCSNDIRVLRITPDSLVLTARVVTKQMQTVDVQEVVFTNGEVRLIPHVMNYLSLAELDELCRDAGLELVERWQDWAGSPWQPGSKNAVSIYGAVSAGTR